ncbi:MAG: hypothetical protein ABF968_04335 [Acetobacter sp.]
MSFHIRPVSAAQPDRQRITPGTSHFLTFLRRLELVEDATVIPRSSRNSGRASRACVHAHRLTAFAMTATLREDGRRHSPRVLFA